MSDLPDIFPFTLEYSDRFGGVPRGFKSNFLLHQKPDITYSGVDVVIRSSIEVEYIVISRSYRWDRECRKEELYRVKTKVPKSLTKAAIESEVKRLAERILREREDDKRKSELDRIAKELMNNLK